MNKFTTQFTKHAKDSVQIREFEREKIREELCLYMEYHPRTAGGAKSMSIERIKKAAVVMFTPVRASVGALALLVLTVALPIAVERSVPGDMLYAIKTVFNDEESDIALRSPYEQIEWDTAQLSNQLEEAQELARAGQLTEETEGEIAEAVRGHSQSARENIAKLKEENPDEAAMAELALESLFDVHTNVLLAVANTQSNEESTVEVAEPGIASSQATETSRLAQAIEESREAVEDGMLSTPSYPTLLSRIDEEYAHAYTVFEQLTGDISTEQLEDINLRFTSIDKKIKQATEIYDAGSETEARLLLTEALLQTRKVVAYMIDLDVRNVVNIDTFIPIEFSKDDFKVELLAKHEQLQLQYEYLDEELNAKDIYTTASSSENIKELQTVPDRFASTSSLLLEGENLSKVGEVLSGIESILLKVAEEFDIEVRLLDTTQTTDEENDKEQTAEEN